MRTGRIATARLWLDDQDDLVKRTDVTDLVTAPSGAAVMRVANDYAAGIVLAHTTGIASFLDEGRAGAIESLRVRADRAIWRHSGDVRSSVLTSAGRCHRTPSQHRPNDPITRATPEAVALQNWFCVQATGRVGTLDGDIVRLVGALAVVRTSTSVRVVDLRTEATVSGPVSGNLFGQSTVSGSGTLVTLRQIAPQDVEIVAARAGTPERVIARGDFYAVRYEDGLIRYRDHTTQRTVEEPLL